MSLTDEIKNVSPEDKARFDLEHETMSKNRVVAFQKRLDAMTESDSSAVTVLRDRLELQIKIEELIVKGREAEHVKWKVYGPTAISIIALAISLFAAFRPH